MQPRQSILEIFSTFVQFAGEHFSCWAMESNLRRSIQSCLNHAPQETSEYFWGLYWYKFWQLPETKPLARQHLIAYLQEPCYWVSQKTVTSFASTQYKLSDCFQIAGYAYVGQIYNCLFYHKANQTQLFGVFNYVTLL